jgi:hypothetical protein
MLSKRNTTRTARDMYFQDKKIGKIIKGVSLVL